jgi:hypothetical protein
LKLLTPLLWSLYEAQEAAQKEETQNSPIPAWQVPVVIRFP